MTDPNSITEIKAELAREITRNPGSAWSEELFNRLCELTTADTRRRMVARKPKRWWRRVARR